MEVNKEVQGLEVLVPGNELLSPILYSQNVGNASFRCNS